METNKKLLPKSIFQPQSNQELRDAVSLWCKDRHKGIETYGHISTWNTGKITDMSNLFYCQCPNTNIKHDMYCEDNKTDNVGWWLEHPCDCDLLEENRVNRQSHCGRRNFNDNINDWDVSKVTDASKMFKDCFKYNQPMDKWNLKSIKEELPYRKRIRLTKTQYANRIFTPKTGNYKMFDGCYSFNQDLSNWKILNEYGYVFGNCDLDQKLRPKQKTS